MRKTMTLLWRQSPTLLIVASVASVLCALLQVGLLRFVSQYVGNPSTPSVHLWIFALFVVGVIVTHLTSTLGVGYMADETVCQIRTGLAHAILRASLARTEQIGSSSLLNNIQEDCGQIVNALPGFTGLIRDVLFAVGCLAYLGYLSPTVFLIMSCIIGIGVLGHTPLQKQGVAAIKRGAVKAEKRFALLRNLIEGAKQLKLNARLRADLLDELYSHDVEVSRFNRKAFLYFTSASSVAVGLLFVLVAVMIYSHVGIFHDPTIVASYTLAIFFLLNPLQGILSMAQSVSQAGVALARIEGLQQTLASAAEPAPSSSERNVDFGLSFTRSLELSRITHIYSSGDRRDFALGPVDLVLHPGQVLFIVGGNGSGKTTLAKIIMGLYTPEEGTVLVDGTPIDDRNRDSYRRLFSGVPSDFCLFDGLAHTKRERFAGEAGALLSMFRLDHVVEPEHGIYAQAKSFSSGERRRVALLLSWLDDTSIYVFDEFAADQDPEAKAFFYNDVLDELRRRKKLVVVVTHDNRYFDEADIILALERNQPPTVRLKAARSLNVPAN